MANNAMLTFAINVRRIMERRGWTQVTLSQKSGVGQTTLSGLLRYNEGADKVSTLDTVAAIAKAFNIEPWLLQIPDVPIDVLMDGHMEALIEVYADVGPEGREHIRRVAESEARYETFRSEHQKAG